MPEAGQFMGRLWMGCKKRRSVLRSSFFGSPCLLKGAERFWLTKGTLIVFTELADGKLCAKTGKRSAYSERSLFCFSVLSLFQYPR
jgi:hypothetical protein